MELVSNLVNFQPKQLDESDSSCPKCYGSGMEVISGKGARACSCSIEKARERRLAKIPTAFSGLKLDTIKPDAKRHHLQADAINAMRKSPTQSFFLAGDFGSGKTMMMWLLYRHLIESQSGVPMMFTMIELLNEYKAVFNAAKNNQTPIIPRLSADMLRQNRTRYAIFLDDIDKARPTEYAAEQVFDLVDAIYAYGHQLVVTTNLRAATLVNHFDKADERYGGAIVRRMLDNARRFEMF